MYSFRKVNALASAITLFLFFSLALQSAAPVAAQTETGQLTVKSLDPQGAVVTGAAVTVRSVDRGATLPGTTNEEGIAVFPNLQPGFYDVTVTAAGFANATQRVQVTVGSRPTVEVPLTVTGATGETVTVVAEGGVEVNTQTQELSNVVSGTQLRELPNLTRDPYGFVGLSANVSDADPSGRGTGFAINGQRAASTNVLLDGADNNDVFTASVGQRVPLDSVQEFRVITSNFTAEYGRAAGGVVNVATRAGSNDFRGTLYEFNRNSAFASNSFENNANGVPLGQFNRNQFGYSLGGPILRDKLFFFSSTEWIRARSTENQINLVPTPQLLAASAPATQAFFNTFPLATQISGRVFTVGELTEQLNLPAGTAFTNLPANLPAFGQVIYPVPNDIGGGIPQNTYQTVARFDFNWTPRTQLYGRYALESSDFFSGTNSFSPFAGFNTGSDIFNNNFLLNLTHTFSPSVVSQSKFAFNRLNNGQPLGAQPASPGLYFFANQPATIGGFNVALPGYLPFNPGSAIPFGGPQNLFQAYEDVNYTRGQHQFRFGGTALHIQDNRTFGAYQNAVQTLGTGFSAALANLVQGNVRQFQVAIDPQGRFPGEAISLPVSSPNFSRSNRFNEWAAYAQDSWRINPRLTVNLGLRYEYFGVQHNKDRSLDANFYLGEGATLQERIANGQVFRAEESPIGQLWRSDKNNFAPRLGVAWDLFGDGSTSVRGGYGIAYERNFGNVTFNVIQNPPNYATLSITAGSTPGFTTIPISSANFGPVSGTGGTLALLPATLRAVNPDISTAYAHTWSAALERQLTKSAIVSLEYSGSAGRDLYSISNINRIGSGAVYLGNSDPTSTINTQYGSINWRDNRGRSNYNAFIAEMNTSQLRNLGLQFTARYTYSVARDNLSSTFSEATNNINLGFLDPFDPDLDYGYADFDIRHRFVASWNWEVPFFRTASGLTNALLSGWELTGIFTARTGNPFTVFDCTNAAFEVCPRLVPSGPLEFRGQHDPQQVAGSPNRFTYIDLSNQTPGNFINPVTGTSEFGPFPENMTRRNQFRGPGAWNLDSGLYKRFRFTETTGLQLRFEVFNVFNHSNLYVIPGQTDISSFDFVPARRGVTFGNVQERRNVQLAAKITF
ncbi:MAG: TonB-dependent receptor domain-containing protein [Blastocatellia bacterium]